MDDGTTPHLDRLSDPALDAYLQDDPPDAPAGLRRLGAVVSFDGVVGNGGLMDTVLQWRFTDHDDHLDDAEAALRWLGLSETADLVVRARTENVRMCPEEDDEISEADGELWDELDEAYYALMGDDVLERAVTTRLDELG
jgi:hypothetical protein